MTLRISAQRALELAALVAKRGKSAATVFATRLGHLDDDSAINLAGRRLIAA